MDEENKEKLILQLAAEVSLLRTFLLLRLSPTRFPPARWKPTTGSSKIPISLVVPYPSKSRIRPEIVSCANFFAMLIRFSSRGTSSVEFCLEWRFDFLTVRPINARAASSGSIPAAVGYLLMALTLTIACGFGALVIGGTLPSSLFSANDRRLGGPRATGILQRSEAAAPSSPSIFPPRSRQPLRRRAGRG